MTTAKVYLAFQLPFRDSLSYWREEFEGNESFQLPFRDSDYYDEYDEDDYSAFNSLFGIPS